LFYWHTSKIYGLPNGNIGWANEPIDLVLSLMILESEHNNIVNEEIEKKKRDWQKNNYQGKRAKNISRFRRKL